MKSFNVTMNGIIYTVNPIRDGYRIKLFVRNMGYIGSFYPNSYHVRYCDGENRLSEVVRGKITGVKTLINWHLNRFSF